MCGFIQVGFQTWLITKSASEGAGLVACRLLDYNIVSCLFQAIADWNLESVPIT